MVEKADKLGLSKNGSLKRLVQVVILSSAFWAYTPAQADNLRLISDEETELFLGDILYPIYKSAGIKFYRNNLYIVEDRSLNAFVADGNSMFVHTGTIMQADNYNQIAGVLAHETGHIQGGHILRQKLKSQSLQQASIASLVAAGVLGAVTGRPDVGMAIALGSQSSAFYSMNAYQVQEERSADEAAINLLNQSQQSTVGLRDFMKKIQQQNTLSGIEEHPYFRTHPVTSERVTFLNKAAEQSKFTNNAQMELWFLRIKAKLIGFLDTPEQTFRKYPASNTSAPARYARSIAYFKQLKIEQALANINSLIAEEPNNPFFHELKAQIYIETGKIKEARKEYEIAYKLLPNSALFQLNLAQAMLEDEPSEKEIDKIINLLNKSLLQKPDSLAWLFLSRAYGMKNDVAYSNYAAAEFSLRTRAIDVAERQVKEAEKASPSPALKIKLQDLNERLVDLKKKKQQF